MKQLVLILAFLATLIPAAQAQTRKTHWAQLDGNKIRYYDIGTRKKDAIIFIHGWTCNADFWKDSLDAFPRHRVIALDLIGHGQSDKPMANYSMEYFARSVEAVMKKAGVKRAVLVGHSMGTPVARQFYRRHPERTLGMVVVDGALARFFPRESMMQFIEPLKQDFAKNAGTFVDGMLAPIRDDGLKKRIRETMVSATPYVAVSAWEGMADEAIWGDDKINVPVLALMAPSFWPPNVKAVFSSIAPNIDFQMWNGVSHFLMMEKPVQFNQAVEAYIQKNRLL